MGRRNKSHRIGFRQREAEETRAAKFREILSRGNPRTKAYKAATAYFAMQRQIRASRPMDQAAVRKAASGEYTPKTPAAKLRNRKLRHIGKLVKGQREIRYARQGFGWVNGKYVKLEPTATGITLAYAAPLDGYGVREGTRMLARVNRPPRWKAKAKAKERFDRRQAAMSERLAAHKRDKREAAEKVKRLERQLAYYQRMYPHEQAHVFATEGMLATAKAELSAIRGRF